MIPEEAPKEYRFHVSVLIGLFGLFMSIIQINFDGEPGAIPLLFILIGVVWYFIHQRNKKAVSEEE